jgi:hypothetical protein
MNLPLNDETELNLDIFSNNNYQILNTSLQNYADRTEIDDFFFSQTFQDLNETTLIDGGPFEMSFKMTEPTTAALNTDEYY